MDDGSKMEVHRYAASAEKSMNGKTIEHHTVTPAGRRWTRAITVSEWISVKDRLPEQCRYNGTVLATDGVTVITAPSSSVGAGEAITHWMELPEPPKEFAP